MYDHENNTYTIKDEVEDLQKKIENLGTWKNADTVQCFEIYGKQHYKDAAAEFRAALDTCLDVNKFNTGMGMSWAANHIYPSGLTDEKIFPKYESIKEPHYTSPEFVITNYKTIHQMKRHPHKNGGLKNVILFCDDNQNCSITP